MRKKSIIKSLCIVSAVKHRCHCNGSDSNVSSHVLSSCFSQLPQKRVSGHHINTSAFQSTMAHAQKRCGIWSISPRSVIRIDHFLRELTWRSVRKICMHLMWFSWFWHTLVHAVSRNKSSIQILDPGDALHHQKQRDARDNINREAIASLRNTGGYGSQEALSILMPNRQSYFECT